MKPRPASKHFEVAWSCDGAVLSVRRASETAEAPSLFSDAELLAAVEREESCRNSGSPRSGTRASRGVQSTKERSGARSARTPTGPRTPKG